VGCHELSDVPYLLYLAASTQGSGWPAIEIGLQVEDGQGGWGCGRDTLDSLHAIGRLPVLVLVLTTVNAVMTQNIVAGSSYIPNSMQHLAYSVHAVASSLIVINNALVR